MLTHIVFFKLEEPTSTNIASLCDVLRGLEGQVPQLRGLEVGVDIVRSARSYDVALIGRFDSLDDLEAYQKHPYHQEALSYIRRVTSQISAVDFES